MKYNDYLDVPCDVVDKAVECCEKNGAVFIFISRETDNLLDSGLYLVLANKPSHAKVYGEGHTYITWILNERGTDCGHYGMTFKKAMQDFSERLTDFQSNGWTNTENI